MATLTAKELEARRTQLITEFEGYCEQVKEALSGVTQALQEQRYAEACSIMSTISAHQGAASVNMRTVLVKNGMIVRERTDD